MLLQCKYTFKKVNRVYKFNFELFFDGENYRFLFDEFFIINFEWLFDKNFEFQKQRTNR